MAATEDALPRSYNDQDAHIFRSLVELSEVIVLGEAKRRCIWSA
jgi:hypothetical protein